MSRHNFWSLQLKRSVEFNLDIPIYTPKQSHFFASLSKIRNLDSYLIFLQDDESRHGLHGLFYYLPRDEFLPCDDNLIEFLQSSYAWYLSFQRYIEEFTNHSNDCYIQYCVHLGIQQISNDEQDRINSSKLEHKLLFSSPEFLEFRRQTPKFLSARDRKSVV